MANYLILYLPVYSPDLNPDPCVLSFDADDVLGGIVNGAGT